MTVKIAIVDDKNTNRIMLGQKLQKSKSFNVLFTANSGEDFLEKMKHHEADCPDIVLMDLEMPGMGGTSTIAIAATLYPDIKFVVLTVFDEDEKIFKAIQAGACGYLLKEEELETIEEILLSAFESGSVPMSPSIARRILQILSHAQWSPPEKINDEMQFDLSEREEEVLKWLVNGLDYKNIAEKLFISPLTVRKHIANIYRKLHVNSKAQVLKLAYTKRLV